MLCFTADACNRDLSSLAQSSIHKSPPSISFFLDLPCLSVGARKIRWPSAKPGPLPHQQHPVARLLLSLPSVSQHNTGENDTGREAEGAEPLLTSGLSQPWLWFGNDHSCYNREELGAHCSAVYSVPFMAPSTCTHIFPQASSRLGALLGAQLQIFLHGKAKPTIRQGMKTTLSSWNTGIFSTTWSLPCHSHVWTHDRSQTETGMWNEMWAALFH